MAQAHISPLRLAVRLLFAGLAGAALTAVAGSIALVAFAAGLDAALLPFLSPAAASAATGGVFAVLCCAIGILTLKVLARPANRETSTLASDLGPLAAGLGVEICLTVLTGLVGAVRRRRRPASVTR